jgi:hypothetical protein
VLALNPEGLTITVGGGSGVEFGVGVPGATVDPVTPSATGILTLPPVEVICKVPE